MTGTSSLSPFLFILIRHPLPLNFTFLRYPLSLLPQSSVQTGLVPFLSAIVPLSPSIFSTTREFGSLILPPFSLPLSVSVLTHFVFPFSEHASSPCFPFLYGISFSFMSLAWIKLPPLLVSDDLRSPDSFPPYSCPGTSSPFSFFCVFPPLPFILTRSPLLHLIPSRKRGLRDITPCFSPWCSRSFFQLPSLCDFLFSPLRTRDAAP